MKETSKVTIRTAMDTEDVVTILQKIEDDLCEIVTELDVDKQILTTRLNNLLNFVQSLSYDIEKNSELKENRNEIH